MDLKNNEKAFHALHASLYKAVALLKAVLSLPCFESMAMDEHFEVETLLQLCQEHTGQAFELFGECEGAYNGLVSRIRWKPQPGDQIPVELVSGLVSHAIEPAANENWQYEATEIGKMLLAYAKIHTGLQLMVAPWISFIRSHGGDARLIQYENGKQEITWNGSLAKGRAI